MEQLTIMFSEFVAFVGGCIFITEAVNKLFKVENSRVKWIISWVMSIWLAIVGFVLQLGIFADCGTVDQWSVVIPAAGRTGCLES